MPITLKKPKPKSDLLAVERLLEAGKKELPARLPQMELWVFMVRAGILMDNERFEDAQASALFPTTAKFAGEPETAGTYETARKAMKGDYDKIVAELKTLKPTEQEQRQFIEVHGAPGTD